MASKETSSDHLKKFFASQIGGSDKDWKRLSKKNNDAGQPVRVFENKTSGEKLEVVEIAEGRFMARRLSETVNGVFGKLASEPFVYNPVIEQDPASRSRAAKIVAELEDFEDVSRRRIKKDALAVANHFVFAVVYYPGDGVTPGEYCAFVTGYKSWLQDQLLTSDTMQTPLWDIMPKGADQQDGGLYVFFNNDGTETYHHAMDVARDMIAKGFKWDPDFQFNEGAEDEAKQHLRRELAPLSHAYDLWLKTRMQDAVQDLIAETTLQTPEPVRKKSAAAKAPVADGLTPAIDTDAYRNMQADDIIQQLDENGEFENTGVINTAGRALANRFVFAVGQSGDDFFVEFSPKDVSYDGHLEGIIGHLLPKNNGGEVTELTFDFSTYKDAISLVKDLHRAGFVWDEEYQNSMERGLTAEIKTGLVPAASPASNITSSFLFPKPRKGN